MLVASLFNLLVSEVEHLAADNGINLQLNDASTTTIGDFSETWVSLLWITHRKFRWLKQSFVRQLKLDQ